MMAKTEKVLKDIPLKKIDRNPENPRLFFRQQELDDLTESIRKHGVQVPISVYKEGGKYVLLDGERRWRCSLKLNRKTIPAIIQKKPDAFKNLVLMFNIHALREQWDLLTIAVKLPRVIKLYKKEYDEKPNERELSEETGLNRSTIRRCKLLMNLPEHHIDNIKTELKKPKNVQRITEDFYIEMERALTTVSRSMPDIIPNNEIREQTRQVLLKKYKNKIINNIVDFRKVAKIARAGNVHANISKAKKELKKLFENNNYGISKAYDRSVSHEYSERGILNTIQSLIDDLEDFEASEADNKFLSLLEQLVDRANLVLKGRS